MVDLLEVLCPLMLAILPCLLPHAKSSLLVSYPASSRTETCYGSTLALELNLGSVIPTGPGNDKWNKSIFVKSPSIRLKDGQSLLAALYSDISGQSTSDYIFLRVKFFSIACSRAEFDSLTAMRVIIWRDWIGWKGVPGLSRCHFFFFSIKYCLPALDITRVVTVSAWNMQ